MASLSPESYLVRVGGGPTSATLEIGHAAHRLYTLLTTSRNPQPGARLFAFRGFVRLMMHHSRVLLAGADGCPMGCHHHSCWYRADERNRAVLAVLRHLAALHRQGEADTGMVDRFDPAQASGGGNGAADMAMAKLYSMLF